jgi:hypothetical protein
MKYSLNIINAGNQSGDFPAKNLLKPEIYQDDNNMPVFGGGMNYRQTLKNIESGCGIKVQGSYPTAIAFYSWLKNRIIAENPVKDYISSRNTKEIISGKTGKIFLKVSRHKIELEKSPEIPWLRIFYQEHNDFLISLPDILGMNGSWQWYDKGISYPVFPKKLHPWYGVYFPTRTGHLGMFDRWLEKNRGKFTSAVDVGTGCGILSFLMAKHGICDIYGTDINPNAVYSTSLEIIRLGFEKCIRIEQGSFFGSMKEAGGLTVFNPPWIPGKCNSLTDKGIYYEGDFFDTFFSEAEKKLVPGATLVIIFSSFAVEAGLTDRNPVEDAVSQNSNFILEDKITENVRERTNKNSKDWLNRIREREEIELWIIKRVAGE